MVVLTANNKMLVDLKTGRIVASASDEYKGRYNVFHNTKIGDEERGLIIGSFKRENDVVNFLGELCEDCNDRWYPKGK